MLGLDARAFRISWTVLLAAGLVSVLYLLRHALLVFLLAVLFAYVIWPLVRVAEALWRRVWPSTGSARLLALAVVYPVLIGVTVLIAVIWAPQITQQATALFEKLRAFTNPAQRAELLERVTQTRGWSLPVFYAIRDLLRQHAGEILPYLQSGGAQLLRYLSNLWLVALVPILAFFFVKDAERLAAGVEEWFDQDHQRGFLRDLFTDLHDLLAQYMRAVMVLSLGTFASHALFFFVIGLPYALLLATLAGVLEFIPMVGPLSAGVVIVLAAWLAGYDHVLWVLIFLVAWRLIQDYVNMPWVLGSGVKLHPLLVIFGILAGAELAGVAGMFLSAPVMAAVRILLRLSLARARAAP